jgi:hypothetical protein
MNRRAAAISGSLLSLSLALVAADASATERRFPASMCFYDTNQTATTLYNDANGAIGNDASGWGTQAIVLHCPIPASDLTLPSGQQPQSKATINGLFVDGLDGNNSPVDPNNVMTTGGVFVRVCQVEPWSSDGFFCSKWEYATNGGTSTPTFTGPVSQGFFHEGNPFAIVDSLQDPSRWYWYANLDVTIPQPGVFGRSELYGYVIDNN